MPKGPRGEKRPADVIGMSVKVMRIATGEEAEDMASESRTVGSMTAAEMGKRGGQARAKKLNQAQRTAIAKQAARKRWGSK
jgi:hypothetical protein